MMHIDGDLVVIAITVVTTVGMVALGPIGRALADRLRGRVAAGALDAIEERLDEISGQVLSVQRQVGDIIERQEFSERLLARARDRGMLGSGT
jgi:hypothetical protein